MNKYADLCRQAQTAIANFLDSDDAQRITDEGSKSSEVKALEKILKKIDKAM